MSCKEKRGQGNVWDRGMTWSDQWFRKVTVTGWRMDWACRPEAEREAGRPQVPRREMMVGWTSEGAVGMGRSKQV